MSEPTLIRLPQLGEGVREARVVALLAAPGAIVIQDQPVLEVETDKALYTIEAPAGGTLGVWKCAIGTVVEVGTVMVEILPEASGTPEVSRNIYASPRTRGYAADKGISNEEFARIASDLGQSTVGAADVDKWIGLLRHSRFRGIVNENGETQTQDTVVLGVAVALLDDALATAIVSHSEGRTFEEFVRNVREAVNACRQGVRPKLPSSSRSQQHEPSRYRDRRSSGRTTFHRDAIPRKPLSYAHTRRRYRSPEAPNCTTIVKF